MKEIIIEKECPKCKGNGVVLDPAECLFTGGIAFVLGLLDSRYRSTCPRCNGNGIIRHRKIINAYER